MAPLHPHSHYTDFNLPATDRGASLDGEPERVAGIPDLFTRVALHGDVLAAVDSGVFGSGREYRYTGENEQGIDAAINHFQGMLRLGRGREAYLAVSAGDSTEQVAHLFIVHMQSRPVRGPWGSNLRDRGRPADADGIVRVIALDRRRWHPGGMGILGDVLAVPLEGDGTSAVRLLHVADPAAPTCLPVVIERPDLPKAGAAALGRLPGGRWLCVVWREEGKEPPVGRLDFHASTGADLFAGFGPRLSLRFPDLRQKLKRDPQYQAIALLHPPVKRGEDGDGLYYLLGTENGAGDAPFGNGGNFADLYTLRLPKPALRGPAPVIDHVASIELHAPREYFNLDAAAGVYAEPSASGPRLHLYGGYHWRANRTIRFAEFYGRPDPKVAIGDIADGWIELYEHDRFRGRRLTIHADRDVTIADYARIYVQDGDFNERVSSARWQLPDGWVYRLYREPGFGGAWLDLRGAGVATEIADLSKRKFGDVVSSSRFERRP